VFKPYIILDDENVLFMICFLLLHYIILDFPEEKSKVQTHTFTDFPNTAESDEDEVYDKSEVIF
jgi:hypothetical protein